MPLSITTRWEKMGERCVSVGVILGVNWRIILRNFVDNSKFKKCNLDVYSLWSHCDWLVNESFQVTSYYFWCLGCLLRWYLKFICKNPVKAITYADVTNNMKGSLLISYCACVGNTNNTMFLYHPLCSMQVVPAYAFVEIRF